MTEHDVCLATSLAYHREIARRLRADPALVEVARRRLAHGPGELHEHYRDAWQRLIDGPFDALLALLEEDSERARDLRQCTPFVGILDQHTRMRIWCAVRGREHPPRPVRRPIPPTATSSASVTYDRGSTMLAAVQIDIGAVQEQRIVDLIDEQAAAELHMHWSAFRRLLAEPVLAARSIPSARKRFAEGVQKLLALRVSPAARLEAELHGRDAAPFMPAIHAALRDYRRTLDNELDRDDAFLLAAGLDLTEAELDMLEAFRARGRWAWRDDLVEAWQELNQLRMVGDFLQSICMIAVFGDVEPRSRTVFSRLCTEVYRVIEAHHAALGRFLDAMDPAWRDAAARPGGRRQTRPVPTPAWVSAVNDAIRPAILGLLGPPRAARPR